jgi:hypothetical protein
MQSVVRNIYIQIYIYEYEVSAHRRRCPRSRPPPSPRPPVLRNKTTEEAEESEEAESGVREGAAKTALAAKRSQQGQFTLHNCLQHPVLLYSSHLAVAYLLSRSTNRLILNSAAAALMSNDAVTLRIISENDLAASKS